MPALPFCHLTLKAERPKPETYPDELITYGDHIRARRLDAGLSQRQAAEAISVDETSVFNWESNRVQPAVRLVPAIIRFLGYCPYTPALPVSDAVALLSAHPLVALGLLARLPALIVSEVSPPAGHERVGAVPVDEQPFVPPRRSVRWPVVAPAYPRRVPE